VSSFIILTGRIRTSPILTDCIPVRFPLKSRRVIFERVSEPGGRERSQFCQGPSNKERPPNPDPTIIAFFILTIPVTIRYLAEESRRSFKTG